MVVPRFCPGFASSAGTLALVGLLAFASGERPQPLLQGMSAWEGHSVISLDGKGHQRRLDHQERSRAIVGDQAHSQLVEFAARSPSAASRQDGAVPIGIAASANESVSAQIGFETHADSTHVGDAARRFSKIASAGSVADSAKGESAGLATGEVIGYPPGMMTTNASVPPAASAEVPPSITSASTAVKYAAGQDSANKADAGSAIAAVMSRMEKTTGLARAKVSWTDASRDATSSGPREAPRRKRVRARHSRPTWRRVSRRAGRTAISTSQDALMQPTALAQQAKKGNQPTELSRRTNSLEYELDDPNSDEEDSKQKAKKKAPKRKKDVEPKKEEEVEVWQMNATQRLGLQIGWLLLFILLCLAITVYMFVMDELKDRYLKPIEDQPPSQNEGLRGLHGALNGQGAVGTSVSLLVIALSLWNLYAYSVLTESEFTPGWRGVLKLNPIELNNVAEITGLVIFLPVTVLRPIAATADNYWGRYPCAPLFYEIGNVFQGLEMFAIICAVSDIARMANRSHVRYNFLFLFFGRVYEMLERNGFGIGAKRASKILSQDGKLIVAASSIGLVVWLLLGGLYFMANRENDSKAAVWSVAVYHDSIKGWTPWRKFDSIPSSMWIVLTNLLCEAPYADAHVTFFSRALVSVCMIFAVPMFALPIGIIRNSLLKLAEEEEANEGERRSEDVDRADTGSTDGSSEMLCTPVATGCFITISIATFVYYTARGMPYATLLTLPVNIGPKLLCMVDSLISTIFFIEWIACFKSQDLMTALGLIDVLAWLPGYIHLVVYFVTVATHDWDTKQIVSTWICAMCVLRILKMERYLGSFQLILAMFKERKALLIITFAASGVVWMVFSTALYFTDRHNPDPGMREAYGSMLRSEWSEVINLHGEYPWADYTAVGRGVATFIGLISIMLFCVPISVFGGGFQEHLEAQRGNEEVSFDRRPWQKLCRPEEPGMRRAFYDLYYAHLHAGPGDRLPITFQLLRILTILMVITSVSLTCVGTVAAYDLQRDISKMDHWPAYIDTFCTMAFTVELFVRCIATDFKHAWSFYGLCDVLSILMLWQTCINSHLRWAAFHPNMSSTDASEDMIIVFRVLRLFSLESYFFALHTLTNVVKLNRVPLQKAGMALATVWLFHCTLLFLFERPEALGGIPEDEDVGEGEDEVKMSDRYNDMLRASQYSIVHLFGDYPETEYGLMSKFVHAVGIMGGISIISAFSAVFCQGFVQYLADERRQDRVEAMARRAVSFARVGAVLKKRLRALRARTIRTPPPPRQPISGLRKVAKDVITSNTSAGSYIKFFFNLVLLLNLLNTLVATLPQLDRPEHKNWLIASQIIEYSCNSVFFLDILTHVIASPLGMLKPWRVFDMVCLVPGVIVLISKIIGRKKMGPAVSDACEALLIIRAVRILDFPCIKTEVNMVCRALKAALPMLAVPGYLALNVWVTSSCAFMVVENHYKDEGGQAESMPSVPVTMYWTSIFLVGEWANVDFTFLGSRISILYVIFGIAIFSIPVGIISESVQSTLEAVDEENKQYKAAMKSNSTGEKSGSSGLAAMKSNSTGEKSGSSGLAATKSNPTGEKAGSSGLASGKPLPPSPVSTITSAR